MDAPVADFSGNERFLVHRPLGRGGFGAVYQVFDRHYHTPVALKVLHQASPDALYRFKREFRSLARIVHPNLVTLYELLSDDEQWFFTMELVDGRSFLRHFRPPGADFSLDPQQLRDAFAQLAQGLRALHQAGIIHRDLKPENVLVDRAERVVLLDFGLAKELPWRDPAGTRGLPESMVGSPAYMPIEQWTGGEVSEASDWYGMGIMLYEVLTGRLPFPGRVREILAGKLRGEFPPPAEVVEGVPEDLDSLCRELLRLDPQARPSGEEIVRRLGNPRQRTQVAVATPAQGMAALPGGPDLIGREREIAALSQALADCAGGQAVTVFVHSSSGMGKSVLVQSFLAQLAERDVGLILSGRCHERESVPYNALDSLVDALSLHLATLPPEEMHGLLPRDVHDLVRLFPVLRATADTRDSPSPSDDQQVRSRAFRALKELLGNIASRRPLVLSIDDVQWGDRDSAQLLAEVLSTPSAPLLVILCYRSEEAQSSEFLNELRQPGVLPGRQVREVMVGPLAFAEARDMSLTLMDTDSPAVLERAEAIARAAQGWPLYIEELVRHVQAGGELDEPAGAGDGQALFRQLLRARLGPLPTSARQLLEVVAVAGRPLREEFATRTAAVGEAALSSLVLLEAANLLRTRGTHRHRQVEAYHDRIRQSVVELLDVGALVACHARLAAAYEATEGTDPEVLTVHFHGARELEKAASYAVAAGDKAAAALAFHRAAEFYGSALAWDGEREDRQRLVIKRADALVNAGRCAEAAPLYMEVAKGEGPWERRELQRRAMEAYLVAGHIDQGLEVLRPLLAEVGIGYPSSSARATFSMIKHFLQLQLRGIQFRPQAESDLPPGRLFPVDLCWSIGKGLSYVMPKEGTDFMIRSLMAALDLGAPVRIGRGLAYMGAGMFTQGGRMAKKGETYLARAEAMAAETGDPYLQGVVLIWRAFSHFLAGQWKAMVEQAEHGLQILQRQCAGVSWECVVGKGLVLQGLEAQGMMIEVSRGAAQYLLEGRELGDLYAQILFLQYLAVSDIASGDIGASREKARWALERWTNKGYTVPHFYWMRHEACCDLYEGMPEVARGRLISHWENIRRAQILRVPLGRIDALLLHARIELLLAEKGGKEPALRSCEKVARQLYGEPIRLDGKAHAALIHAGIAACRGQRDAAVRSLDRCIERYADLDMLLFASCARRRRGELTGDVEQVSSADAWMTAHGIAAPERFARFFAPGFSGRGR